MNSGLRLTPRERVGEQVYEEEKLVSIHASISLHFLFVLVQGAGCKQVNACNNLHPSRYMKIDHEVQWFPGLLHESTWLRGQKS